MRLLDDERGQSVQVGAAILLGFVVIAVTIYQVQVVSSQNAEVEFNHNQEVRQDLVELRNAIHNAGSQGTSDSVSVNLGDQYPPRTIFVNPPPIQGALQSQEAGNISINATVQGGPYGGNGNATEIVNGNHTTNRLVYAPRYFELDDTGVTTLEHSLAYNVFENNATDALTDQEVIQGNTLTLTVLQGNLSEQGTRSVSLDPATVREPTDPIMISNPNGPIDLYLPTERPDVWNETIGTSPGEDERVVGYDGQRIHVELAKDKYELQMALVEVGEGVAVSDRYNVTDPGTDNDGTVIDYEVIWNTERIIDDSFNCEGGTCEISEDDGYLTFSTDPNTVGGTAEFSVSNSSVGTLDNYRKNFTDGEESVRFNTQGGGTTTVTVRSGGDRDQITVEVVGDGTIEGIVTDNGTGDAIEGATVAVEGYDLEDTTDANGNYEIQDVPAGDRDVTVEATGYEPQTQTVSVEEGETTTTDFALQEIEGRWFDAENIDSNSPVEEGETLTVSAEINNTGTESDTQNVEVEIENGGAVVFSDTVSVQLNPEDPPQTVEFDWETSEGDAGDYIAAVSTANDSNSSQVSVASGPTFQSLEAEVTGQRGSEANEVTFSYEMERDPGSITFSVEDDLGNNAEETVSANFGQDVAVNLGEGGGPPEGNYPLQITADVGGSSCWTATIENESDIPVLANGDWNEC